MGQDASNILGKGQVRVIVSGPDPIRPGRTRSDSTRKKSLLLLIRYLKSTISRRTTNAASQLRRHRKNSSNLRKQILQNTPDTPQNGRTQTNKGERTISIRINTGLAKGGKLYTSCPSSSGARGGVRNSVYAKAEEKVNAGVHAHWLCSPLRANE